MKSSWFLSCLLVFALTGPAWAVTYQQADALYMEKKFEEARPALLRVASENAATTQGEKARFQAAKCLFEEGKFPEFEKEARELLERYPSARPYDRHDMELQLARIPMQQGDYEKAALQLGAVADRHPTAIAGAKARSLQGEAYGKLKQYDKARQAYLKMAEDDRKEQWSMQARHRAARCLFQMGKYDEFVKEAQELLNLKLPEDNHDVQLTRFALAQTPANQGRPEESGKLLESFIAENPSFTQLPLARHRSGRFLMQAADRKKMEGKDEQARELSERAKSQLSELNRVLSEQIKGDPQKAGALNVRNMILHSYEYQHDYAGLAREAEKLATEFHAPSKLWAAGMVWLGIARASGRPADLQGAAKALDAVLEANVQDENLEDHVPTKAAYWRASIAYTQNDKSGLQAALGKLRQMPEGPVKAVALKRFANIK